jgi:hypothetical protein
MAMVGVQLTGMKNGNNRTTSGWLVILIILTMLGFIYAFYCHVGILC